MREPLVIAVAQPECVACDVAANALVLAWFALGWRRHALVAPRARVVA